MLPVRYWYGDESRFGLKSIPRRRLTMPGIKPVGPQQWFFQAYYLYGLVEPATGEHFLLEFSHCDSTCFQVFLEHFARRYPNEHHIIQLDRAGFHTTAQLQLPDNIELVFQPAHCPELHPIERLWQALKEDLAWHVFSGLDDLRVTLDQRFGELTTAAVASLCGYDFILNALKYSNIF